MKNKYVKLFAVLFLSFILLVSGASFAWFYGTRDVTIGNNESQMSVTVGGRLEVAVVPKEGGDLTWGQQIKTNILKNNIMDVSGNGEKFYYPLALDAEDKVILDEYAPVFNNEDDGLAEETYLLQLRVKLRTTNRLDVFLGKDSAVSRKGGFTASAFDQHLNADNIAGCARVAFLEVDGGKETLKYVWVPNSTYKFTEISGVGGGYQFQSGNAEYREEKYKYVTMETKNGKETYVEKSYTVEDYLNGKLLIADGTQPAGAQLADPAYSTAGLGLPVVRFEKEGVMQEKEVLIRIWFEGTDREAHSAFNRGMVDYNIHFAGLHRKADYSETEIEKLKTIVYSPSDNKLHYGTPSGELVNDVIYSYNGIDWQPYDGTGRFAFEDDYEHPIYLRLKETLNVYASEAHTCIAKRQLNS